MWYENVSAQKKYLRKWVWAWAWTWTWTVVDICKTNRLIKNSVVLLKVSWSRSVKKLERKKGERKKKKKLHCSSTLSRGFVYNQQKISVDWLDFFYFYYYFYYLFIFFQCRIYQMTYKAQLRHSVWHLYYGKHLKHLNQK